MAKMLRITVPDGRQFEMPDVRENRRYYERLNQRVNDSKDKVKIESFKQKDKALATGTAGTPETGGRRNAESSEAQKPVKAQNEPDQATPEAV